MMLNEKFLKEVKEELEARYSGEKINMSTVVKENGRVFHGFSRVAEGYNAYATVYAENMFANSEELSPREVADRIAQTIEVNHPVNIDMEFIKNFEVCRALILPKLIRKENNQEYLANKVYKDSLGSLVCLFEICLNDTLCPGIVNDACASITVTRELCRMWNVGADELEGIALANMKEKGYDMDDITNVLMGISAGTFDPEDLDLLEGNLFVLKSRRQTNGASAILDTNLMTRLADRLKGIIVLPSSRHEVLIVPMHGEEDDISKKGHFFSEMVKTVNATEVTQEDYLCDEVYYFASSGAVSVIA